MLFDRREKRINIVPKQAGRMTNARINNVDIILSTFSEDQYSHQECCGIY